jgi:hypothetical protein
MDGAVQYRKPSNKRQTKREREKERERDRIIFFCNGNFFLNNCGIQCDNNIM